MQRLGPKAVVVPHPTQADPHGRPDEVWASFLRLVGEERDEAVAVAEHRTQLVAPERFSHEVLRLAAEEPREKEVCLGGCISNEAPHLPRVCDRHVACIVELVAPPEVQPLVELLSAQQILALLHSCSTLHSEDGRQALRDHGADATLGMAARFLLLQVLLPPPDPLQHLIRAGNRTRTVGTAERLLARRPLHLPALRVEDDLTRLAGCPGRGVRLTL